MVLIKNIDATKSRKSYSYKLHSYKKKGIILITFILIKKFRPIPESPQSRAKNSGKNIFGTKF